MHDRSRTRDVSSFSRCRFSTRNDALRIDPLDIDLRHALPERARLPRRHQVRRLSVERHDGDLTGARLHGDEVLGRGLASTDAIVA